jgi:hypothetical protein
VLPRRGLPGCAWLAGRLRSALDAGFADFEDAVVHEAARQAGAAAIVTRNGKDFVRSELPVFSPAELLAAMRAESA